MSTQDFLAKSAFDNLANSIEQALSDTEGFRDEAENFADLARRGIRLVGVVANLSSFPANPEDGDAVLVESETQIYFWDATSSEWKNSQIVGSAIWGNVQGTLSDQTDLQTALDGKADLPEIGTWTPVYAGDSGEPDMLSESGQYIQINDFVHCTFQVQGNRGTMEGNIKITGLPFTSSVLEPVNFGRRREFLTNFTPTGIIVDNEIWLYTNASNEGFQRMVETDLRTSGATSNRIKGSFILRKK